MLTLKCPRGGFLGTQHLIFWPLRAKRAKFFDTLFANRLTFHYASFGGNKFEIGRVVFPLISIKGRGLKCFLPVKSPQSKNFKI